jgi:hypothetical protein
MTRVLNPTKFTPLQLELLKFYSVNPTEEEILEVKRFLAKMFWKKLSYSVEIAAQEKGLTNEDLDKWLEDENQ